MEEEADNITELQREIELQLETNVRRKGRNSKSFSFFSRFIFVL